MAGHVAGRTEKTFGRKGRVVVFCLEFRIIAFSNECGKNSLSFSQVSPSLPRLQLALPDLPPLLSFPLLSTAVQNEIEIIPALFLFLSQTDLTS